MTAGSRSTCVACGGETVPAKSSWLLRLRPAEDEKRDYRFANVPVRIRVCRSCGRIDLYADDLSSFQEE